eukprot:TRINITY_DN2704_c0_g1_i5.p1 TRINITY_DN2704_c0_g1~~TRINITY_DN2704_c0_g1_i5.p1  ORF type:complete len:1075 (+),score=268.81 TRINITY_DN2704_c0_g1_i5:1053-4277(+)
MISGYGNSFDMNAVENLRAGDATQTAGNAVAFSVSGIKTQISYSTIIGLQAGMILSTNNASVSAQNGQSIGILMQGSDDIVISGNYISSDSTAHVVFSGANASCEASVDIECYPENTCCIGCRVAPSGTVCGSVAGECQLLPTCDGVSASCPSYIAYKPAGSSCELAEEKPGFTPPNGICTGRSAECNVPTTQLASGQSVTFDMPQGVSFPFVHSFDFSKLYPVAKALLLKVNAKSNATLDYSIIARPVVEISSLSTPEYSKILSGCPFTFPAETITVSTMFNSADGTASVEFDYLDVAIPANKDVTLQWVSVGNNYFVYYPISTQPISFLLNGSVETFAFADATCKVISGSGRSGPQDFTVTPTNTDPIYFWISSTTDMPIMIHVAQSENDPNKAQRTVSLQTNGITHDFIASGEIVQFMLLFSATQMASVYLSVKSPLSLTYGGVNRIFSSSDYVQMDTPVDTSQICPQLTGPNSFTFTLSQIPGLEGNLVPVSISATITGDSKQTDSTKPKAIYTEANGSPRYYVFYPTADTTASCLGTFHIIVKGDVAEAAYGSSCNDLSSEFTHLASLGSFSTTLATTTCDPVILKLQTVSSQSTRSRSSVAQLSLQITNSKYIYCGDNICQMELGEDETTCAIDCDSTQLLSDEDKSKMRCGDGTCQSVLGENCGTCSVDCGPVPCKVCGDGVCDANEDCSSCYTDCGPCNNQTVQQCEQCNTTNSVCGNNGQCICAGIFSGTTCSIETIQISPAMDEQRPAAMLSIPSSPNITFEVAATALEERTITGTLVSRVIIPGLTFVLDSTADEDSNSITTYTASLQNGAQLIVALSYYPNSYSIESIGGAISVPAQTIKSSIEVRAWPFQSVNNIFGITLSSFAISESVNLCSYTTESEDQSGNLRWLKIARNGLTLYGQFNEKAMMDNVVKNTNYKLTNVNNEVIAVMPHFWSSARIETRYTIINDTEISNTTAAICGVQSTAPTLLPGDDIQATPAHMPGSVGMSTGLTVGIIAGIIGAVIVAAAITAFFIHKRNKKNSKILTRRMATVASLRTGKPHKPDNTAENPLHRPATFTEIKL